MKRGRAVLLTGLLGAAAAVGSQAMGEDKAVEKAGPEASADDPYWTPERLRAAKPLELPHPSGPPPEAARAPGETPPLPSVSGPGSPGSGIPAGGDDLLEPAPEKPAKP